MKIYLSRLIFLCLIFISLTNVSISQEQLIIDRIVSKIGDKVILQSDIENQVLQYMAQGYKGGKANIKCEVLNDLMVQKLLLTQAELDSIQVGYNEVESEISNRLNYFVRQIGSEKKLEEFYNKSMLEIKEDFRPLIEEQIKTQKMQRDIVSGIDISPKDARKFYNSLKKDSIPMVNTQYEISQILIYPPKNEIARNEAREKLLNIRQRIIDGERFSTLAVLYSEDPGSSRRGGELGFRTRDELDPAFAKAAFILNNDGGISRIVESEYGFHIIQLIAKEGNQANVRHILIIPKIEIEQKIIAKNKLDSIANLIKSDSLSFKTAALVFSKDEQSKYNNGIMVNPLNTSTKFELEELIKEEYNVITKLKIGDISEPFETIDNDGKVAFKVVKISNITEAHRANLNDDYELIENMALMNNQQSVFEDWIIEKKQKTYIYVDEYFLNCEFIKDGWIK